MALSEIEKLERRYAENPQGLTFAPLAEVHRKNGDVPRALELLQPGLTLHPDYIPASIVLGRCHLDLGDLASAETAFAHVLALDGENVIALKALADIAERLMRFDEAERWLTTLLAIDRSNDEAKDQLGRVEAARRQAGAGSSAAPDAAAAAVVEAPLDLVLDEMPPAVSPPPLAEAATDAVPAWMEHVGDETADETGDGTADEAVPLALEELDASLEAGPPPEGIVLEQPVSLEEPVEPLAGLVGRSDVPAEPDGAYEMDDVEDAFRVETDDDIVLSSRGNGEFQVANAAEELLVRGLSPEPPPPPEPPPVRAPFEPEIPPIEAETAMPAAEADPAAEPEADAVVEPVAADALVEPAAADPGPPVPWSAPLAEPPRRPDPDLLVTESMAELLVQQGHAAEAVTVYRHLESRMPGETRFSARISELEQAAAAAAPAAVEAPRPEAVYSVRQTHGQSVQAFLRGVLGGRLPAQPAAARQHQAPAHGGPSAAPDGAPTRPAHDTLSLSSVFGEDSPPSPPAVPAAGGTGGQGDVSFDEFFGAPGAPSAPRSPRAADSKSDDLDQFHAWLQNLKR